MYAHGVKIGGKPLIMANQINQARVRPAYDNLPGKPKERRVIDHIMLRCGKCLHIGLPGIQPSDDTAPKPSRKCKQILRSHRDYAILSDQQVETRVWGVAADKSVFRDQSCAIEPQDIKVGYHEDLAVKHGDIL